jgi:hypothetical protein
MIVYNPRLLDYGCSDMESSAVRDSRIVLHESFAR